MSSDAAGAEAAGAAAGAPNRAARVGSGKKSVPKRGGKGKGKRSQTPVEDESSMPQPGVALVNFTVEIEAEVRPFLQPIYPQSSRAFDQRFRFLFPGQTQIAPEGEVQLQPEPTVTPPTGVWEPVAGDGHSGPVKWSQVYPVRLDRAALLGWEDLSLSVEVEERSLDIPALEPMFHPDGRLMTTEEAEKARAEQAALEAASNRKRKPGSASGSTSARDKEKEREAKAKEKEKERLRKKKEKDKKDRLAKGLPDEPEEVERVSTAHPLLEEEDVPWELKQLCDVPLSPILFSPFLVFRSVSQSLDASLNPPGGLLSYTVRVAADIDPIDPAVRRELNPALITVKRVDNLPMEPLGSWRDMNDTYKSVFCRYQFFDSGTTREVRPPTPEPDKAPLTGRAMKEATAAAAAAATADAESPSPVPPILQPVPPARFQSLSFPHASTVHLNAHRVIFLGLFDRSTLAAQVQSTPLEIELHDRDHRLAWSEEERQDEERRKKEKEERAAREAEEALAAKNKKGKKKSANDGSLSSRQRSARKKEEKEEVVEEAPPPVVEEEQLPEALAHLSFTPLSPDDVLTQAAADAAAACRFPPFQPTPADPPRYDAAANIVGVAQFRLDDLFRGSTHFDLCAPVQPRYPPSHVKLIPPQKRSDPYRASAHKDETTLHLSVRLSCPYTGAMPHETYHRFERAVVCFRYDDGILYRKLLSAITATNAALLRLNVPGSPEGPRWGGSTEASAPAPSQDEMGSMSRELMSLNSVRLSADQQADDSPLDLLTSVQVIDDAQRVFIVEGRSRHHGGRSLPQLLERLGREQGNLPPSAKDYFHLLSHPAITFPTRLYTGFHAAPKNIRLSPGVTLQSLAKSNRFYVVPKYTTGDAWKAFNCLFQLLSVPRLRVAMRENLFPTAAQLLALEKQCGSWVSEEDLLGRPHSLTQTDRYDPVLKHVVKRMPDPSAAEKQETAEIERPRSRGMRRNKLEQRSFEKDMSAIRRGKREAARQAKEELQQQMDMFNALQGEILQQGQAELSSTQLASTLNAPLSPYSTRPPSADSANTSRWSDAEVAEERVVGFQRQNVTQKKEELDLSNEAYLAAKRAQKQRAASAQFVRANISRVQAASAALAATKSPSDYPRYLHPHELGVREFHTYAFQKNNVYELQKQLMRQQIQEAEARSGEEHHYSYSAEYLSASFEKFLPEEEERKREAALRAKWLTQDGFRWPAHKTHADSMKPWKDLHPARVEALNKPPEAASTNLAALLNGKSAPSSPSSSAARVAHPSRFRARHVQCEEFGMPGNPDWGRALDVGGDAADELARQARQREREEWRRKLVVRDPNFRVLWTGSGQVGLTNADDDEAMQHALAQFERGEPVSRTRGGLSAPIPQQMAKADLASNMLKDPPARPGLQFKKHIRDAAGRILATKNYAVPDPPVSMHAQSPFVDHNRTLHMRSLEEKERAELEDTPREQRPRFAVTIPTPAGHTIYRRKHERTNIPPTIPSKDDV